jgi:hypothetical protein
MVVTSVTASVDERGAEIVRTRTRGTLAKRIGDSKKLVAFGDSDLGQTWARAIALRANTRARTPAELLEAIALDSPEFLRAPCPSHHVELCWNTDDERFDGDDEAVSLLARDLDKLERKGVRIERVRVANVCTQRLNDAVAKGISRFELDLHTMERLILDARERMGEDVYALCGKVGGFDYYAKHFGPLGGRLHTALIEGRARSEYLVQGVGRLAFVRDADDTHMLIGLASLVGKWVRDHMMRRIVRYHRIDGTELPAASGYHDPVTTRFIRATELIRRERNVHPSCFERNSLPTSSKKTGPQVSPPRRRPASPAEV